MGDLIAHAQVAGNSGCGHERGIHGQMKDQKDTVTRGQRNHQSVQDLSGRKIGVMESITMVVESLTGRVVYVVVMLQHSKIKRIRHAIAGTIR